MPRLHPSSGIFRNVLATLLLLAMLAGQWTGLEHRVRHAGLASSLHHAGVISDGAASHAGDAAEVDEGYAHSCQLFDAATLAAGIHTASFLTPCARAAQDWRLPWPPRTWQAAFSAQFSSRAPPLD